MRKVKLAMYVSLDGVVENPAWTGPFWSDELSELQRDYLFTSDALLLGRSPWTRASGTPPSSRAISPPRSQS
jgi:hypothetical protein